MKITGIEVDGIMYDLAPINDRGYVCACCDFLNENDHCPINSSICERVLGQCSLQKRIKDSTTVSYKHMKIIPHNKNVICKCISSNEKTTESGFAYKSNDISLYEVVSFDDKVKDDIDINVGDVIRTNSTGTKIEVDDVEYYIFNSKNIVGKIED